MTQAINKPVVWKTRTQRPDNGQRTIEKCRKDGQLKNGEDGQIHVYCLKNDQDNFIAFENIYRELPLKGIP